MQDFRACPLQLLLIIRVWLSPTWGTWRARFPAGSLLEQPRKGYPVPTQRIHSVRDHWLPFRTHWGTAPCWRLPSFKTMQHADLGLEGVSLHCCWGTLYIFAYCVLVGNPHLTAEIYLLFLPFQRQPSLERPLNWLVSTCHIGSRPHAPCLVKSQSRTNTFTYLRCSWHVFFCVFFYWGSAKNTVFSYHTKSRDDTHVCCC